jgi:hypothetical protein
VDDVVLLAIHIPYRDDDETLPILVEFGCPVPDEHPEGA